MSFIPNIEGRKEYFRLCKCGRDHENKYIRGMFHYSEEDHETIFCAALLEHQNDKHLWLSFITGGWPNIDQEDCAVTAHIYKTEKGRHFSISDGEKSPFISEDVFGSYQVSREEVLIVEGAKEWFVDTYLKLFQTDNEIGSYLDTAIT